LNIWKQRGRIFRILRGPIDTSTPQGMFSLQVLGAVAQLDQAIITLLRLARSSKLA
jgi:DNA invertase Pin-like site-specific DNA recombinase